MNKAFRMLSIFLILVAISLPTIVTAQTPVPKTPPKIKLEWLGSLTLSPTNVTFGQNVIGTLTLLRPAVNDLVVNVYFQGGFPAEGGISSGNGAVTSSTVTVPAGSNKASFTITTSRPSTNDVSKTFTVVAQYGSEHISANFTAFVAKIKVP